MSGFFGMLRTDGTAVEPRFVEEVAQRLRFRGPDGGPTWAKDGLGACFAYLETGTRHQSRRQPTNAGGAARELVRQAESWLPTAGYLPPPLYRRAMFRLKMGGCGASGMAYLMRLSLSPTEEDWSEGRDERGSRVGEAIKRPFRLMRKYGQDG